MRRRVLPALLALVLAAPALAAEPRPLSAAVGRAAAEAGEIEAAVAILSPLAASGDAEARLALGELHLAERFEGADPGEGRLMVLLAATAGLPAAKARYGEMLRTGEMTPRSAAAALDWCGEAAGAGDPRGALCLGRLRRDGGGVRRDAAEAGRWFALAAESGLAEAHRALAALYAEGAGVPRNLRRARDHLLQAAAGGDPESQFRLAEMSRRGRPSSADPQDARRWYAKAAAAGHVAAQRELAALLFSEAAGTADVLRAYAWANVAAARADAEALALRETLADRLDPRELEEAEALSLTLARGEIGRPAPGARTAPGAPAGGPPVRISLGG